MREKNELHKIALFVSPISLLLGVILALIFKFVLTTDDDMNEIWMISTFLGLFTGLMNFGFMVRGSRPSYSDIYSRKNTMAQRSMLYLFFRILVFGSIFSLVVINQLTDDNPSFNVAPTAIGYFLHLVVLLVVYLVFNFKEKKVIEE